MSKSKVITRRDLFKIIGSGVIGFAIGGIVGYYIGSSGYLVRRGKPTKEEIVIGATVPLSGPWSIGGKRYKDAYTALADLINKEGGVYVKEYGTKLPIRLIIYDDKSDPTTAASLYEKLITVDKVDVLIGPGMSALVHAAAEIAEKYKKPMTVIAGDDSIFQRGFHYVFTVWPLASIAAFQFFDWIVNEVPKDEQPKFIGIIQEASAYGEAQAKGALKWGQKYGFKTEIIDTYPPETKDFTPILTKARNSGVDCIVHCGHMIGDIAIPKTVREMGWKLKMIWVSVSITLKEFLRLGDVVEGVTGVGIHSPKFNTPGNDVFIKTYQEKYNRVPYAHDAAAWTSMQVTLKAIEYAGSLDPEKIREALLTQSFPTILGTLHFQENGTPPPEEQAAYLFQVQNGEPVCIWPPKVAFAKGIWPMP